MRLTLVGVVVWGATGALYTLAGIARRERLKRERRAQLERQRQVNRLMLFFQEHEDDAPVFFKAAELGRAMGLPGDKAGLVMHHLGFYSVKRCGYPSSDIYATLEAISRPFTAQPS